MHDFAHFELGRSSLCPVSGSTLFAVATDTPEASQHFLSVMDANVVLGDIRDDPLTCYTRIDKHLSDVRWLNDEVLIGCAGQGDLMLFQFDGQTVKHTGEKAAAAAVLCMNRAKCRTSKR